MTDEKRKKLMEEYAKKYGFEVADLERMYKESIELEDDMIIEDYKKIYSDIVSLSVDCDGFGLFHSIRDRDVEKCKWIAAIMDVLDDVPRSRVKHIFEMEEITDFDSAAFVEENYEE